MKVLFIGGTGVISSACTDLAIKKGIELYHLNRGKTTNESIPNEVKSIKADIRNIEQAQDALKNHVFDVVVDWISFLPAQLENNLTLFAKKTKQFIFISSASGYQTPPLKLPITENTPLSNPFWEYSRNKIACEKLLIEKCTLLGINYTIVRPSHTYNKTSIPIFGKYTSLMRMQQGKPVVLPGDGTSIWTLTHTTDFAKGLVGLLNNPKAYNEDFHITSDEWITWEQITRCFAKAMQVEPILFPISSHVLAKFDKELGDGLLGDKCHSFILDNSKIKAAVPDFECTTKFEQGAQEIVTYLNTEKHNYSINAALDAFFDRAIEAIKMIE